LSVLYKEPVTTSVFLAVTGSFFVVVFFVKVEQACYNKKYEKIKERRRTL